MRQISMKPQDVVVAIKIAILGENKRTFSSLANHLALSASEVHASTKRCEQAGVVTASHGDGLKVIKPALKEFLVHGARYAFPAVLGPVTRGMLTASAGPTLSKLLVASLEGPLVWPFAQGEARGPSLSPLYPKVPEAAARDPELYDLLTLLDAIRVGGARDRELASSELEKRI
jgi:hypothetical protein